VSNVGYYWDLGYVEVCLKKLVIMRIVKVSKL